MTEQHEESQERSDRSGWAKPVDRFSVQEAQDGALNLVEGRRLTGPLQGFGQLWEKTYRIRLSDVEVQPARVIEEWKLNFGSFWPKGQRFFAPLAGIKPGEIGLISGAQGPVRMSTGVIVIYSDQESFTYMNPEGHPWSGWITFSAYEDEGDVMAQVQLQVRTSDPIFELGFKFGGSRAEDRMWAHTLQALAAHLGSSATEVESRIVLVDRKRQWSNIRNVRYNAALRTMTHLAASPLRGLARLFRKRP